MTAAPITVQQKKILWTLARAINLSRENLYAAICEGWGRERMSALTAKEADLLIQELRRKQAALGPDRVTPAQQDAIRAYMRRLGWDKLHLTNYVKKRAGVDRVEWLTVRQARAILTGLEKIRRKEEKDHGLQ